VRSGQERRNVEELDLPFELVAQLDWETAVAVGKRLHAAVITMCRDAVHVISFRKANRKEVRRYEKQKG